MSDLRPAASEPPGLGAQPTPPAAPVDLSPSPRRVAAGTLGLIGLGGLFAGVTGPLLSTFVPVAVAQALGERRTLIGVVMALDNVLLLLLVPWAGSRSDAAVRAGHGRLTLVVVGFLLTAAGMALFPWAMTLGIGGVLAAMVVLFGGINLQRSPFQALIADAVPSPQRSRATASVVFQMCVGAIVFLMLGRVLGMTTAFLVAAVTVVALATAMLVGVRRASTPPGRSEALPEADAARGGLVAALVDAVRGTVPGMRQVFVASLLLQLTFQTFTTWFALHGTERFGVRAEDVTTGFIAWALGGVAGALPAGWLGVRYGRRPTMLLGFGLMAACLALLDRVDGLGAAVPLIALASAAWTLPTVNAFPLFVEPIPPARRGVLSALFLLSLALGGALGDPLNGLLFDAAQSYRPMFLLMALYTALAFVAVLVIPGGTGEAPFSSVR